MSSRRDEMLEELGLTPLWRLREVRAPERVAAPAPLPENDRRAVILRMDWTALKDAVAGCRDCALHARRNKTVFGVGDENADWMFVGEGPGARASRPGVSELAHCGTGRYKYYLMPLC